MKILLVGEYSRLHNSLKEGLVYLNHEVILVGSGDGFKKFPVDFSIAATFCENKYLNKFRQFIFLLSKFDLSKIERGIRFYLLLPKLKGYDTVQLINEMPIQTIKIFELFLLKKLKKNNNKMFLLSSGVDYLNVKYMIENPDFKSVLQPYFKDSKLKKHFDYIFEYKTKRSKKIHEFLYNVCNGVIATDIDYLIPLQNNIKFLQLIPNPININFSNNVDMDFDKKINIFLGINRWNYHAKGIIYFEEAFEKIKKKYSEKVEIIITENIPYERYINLYSKAHIVLDQVFANDQGYNALEAMAKGKVVFTGAETVFENHYELDALVAINALPETNYLVNRISELIENPSQMAEISKNAINFIKKNHDYIVVSQKYIDVWNEN